MSIVKCKEIQSILFLKCTSQNFTIDFLEKKFSQLSTYFSYHHFHYILCDFFFLFVFEVVGETTLEIKGEIFVSINWSEDLPGKFA